MSTDQITVKHNKHRIHPCPNDKKFSLINHLISNNPEAKIIVVSTESVEILKDLAADNITVMNDKELFNSKETTCELLISYDLPTTSIVYMSRLQRASDMALILLDPSEQKQLYDIETLLGRAIKQEKVEGFEYSQDTKLKIAQKPAEKPKEYEFKKTYEEKPKFDKPKYDKPKREKSSNDKSKQWEKKDRAPNKFLGKDENGKAKFSGKSGERNHRYDGTPRDKQSGPKKVGRKISIKARKPKEDSNS